jgi:hypothetical protein
VPKNTLTSHGHPGVGLDASGSRPMSNKEESVTKPSIISATALSALLAVAVDAHAGECVPISGKITNNFASADGTQTLGVVAMVYGPKSNSHKLKCALHGTAIPGTADINFVHSISCDDAQEAVSPVGPVPVHSSIVLYTTGTVGPPAAPGQLFTFQETSVPLPGVPGRGLFDGVTAGQVQVTGAVYAAPGDANSPTPGSIDMKFVGEVCK